MSVLDLARWQFGITTVYHFLFVPLTLGLSVTVAGLQTAWYRTQDPAYLRLTRFFGSLFLVNFAMGVVTGIVQEFQFGMNWSTYSRFVGDVFGAPLAMEGLLAFFLESTFLGLWIFGWDRLSRRAHLATIWLAAGGTWLSAFFILAANSWMQHPVGYRIVGGKAQLTSIGAVLTNSTLWTTFPHTLLAALMTSGLFMLAVAAYQLARRRDVELFRRAGKLAAVTTLAASVLTAVTGDTQARLMTSQQPMKMAAAEALYHTSGSASFSLFTVGTLNGQRPIFQLRIPGLLSFLATGSFHGTVEGVDNIQAAYAARYGAGNYRPYIPVTYWSFRAMVGLGLLAILLSAVGVYAFRRRGVPRSRWFLHLAVAGAAIPFLANTAGWLFTEMGRQPWVVFGMLKTGAAVSPSTGPGEVATSLVLYTLVYAVLAAIELRIMLRLIRRGPDPAPPPPEHPQTPAPPPTGEPEPLPAFSY